MINYKKICSNVSFYSLLFCKLNMNYDIFCTIMVIIINKRMFGCEIMNFILASSSERRKELLKRIVENFEVIPSDYDEKEVAFNGNCSEYVMELSKGKALNVASKLKRDSGIIIASDTIVYFNGEVLGKPSSKEHAYEMLKSLSGEVHEVYSGIVIYDLSSKKIKADYSCSKVKFSNLDDKMIREYIKTGEPMDKAGSYGIQGYGGIFVEKIHGCYYNIVGLPINKLYFLLKEMGVNL
ncbi:septum formation inhibitor Maf [Clostridium tetani]|nr:septum formation inhibitor Maf [Clostridium tetani]RXM58414.1 septum formation inhibitor Maf [Clostridium tetani]RXM75016.1 septum formation inhibitor Maf [Clostridium tetani]RYU98453.1 septum formation inhibitor Maf [Clostridium tetani]BDR65052.1 Maf-like protein [Clostridium tetani]